MELNVIVDTWHRNLGGNDPDDRWTRDSSDGGVNSVRVIGGESGSKPYWRDEPFELDVDFGDTIYVVTVVYGTGDTFGSDGGSCEVLEVFTDASEALEFANLAENPPEPTGKKTFMYDFYFDYKGKKYHRSWAGYFEWLQEMRVDELRVEKSSEIGDGTGLTKFYRS
jgi:hypothetical protein